MAIVLHPDGGHCNTEGMTDECYGCYCYGAGDIKRCKERVESLKRHFDYPTNLNK